MPTIFHITTREAWSQAVGAGTYRGDTLATEGFIHCSTREQVARVANARFHGRSGLVLLCIVPEQVAPEIRYEPAEAGELFPHIYGPLNLDAVTEVVDFPPRADGSFVLPAGKARTD